MPSVRWGIGAFALVAACTALDAPCPCGGRWVDPRSASSSGAAPTNVAHSREDHCICQCDGAGEELYMPPFQRNCASFAVECVTETGRTAQLVCHH